MGLSQFAAALLVAAQLVTSQPVPASPTYNITSAFALAEEMGWDLGDVLAVNITEAAVPYTLPDGSAANGILVTPTEGASTGNIVVILPDWDGVGSFEVANAVRLAGLGNAAFVADTYGADQAQGENANLTNEEKGGLAGGLRSNATNYRDTVSAAIQAAQSTEGAPYENVAIFGYCLGGAGVMEYARSDPATIEAEAVNLMVAFHPGSTSSSDNSTIAAMSANNFTSTLLLNQGTEDPAAVTPEQMSSVMTELDAANSWLNSSTTYYTGAQHGFTQPGGRYNAFAAEMSWQNAMYALDPNKTLEKEVVTVTFFPEATQQNVVVVDVEVTDTNIVSEELTVTFIEQGTVTVIEEESQELTVTFIEQETLTVTFIEQETLDVTFENEVVVDIEVTDTDIVSQELTVTFIEQETQVVAIEEEVVVEVEVTDTNKVSEGLTVTFIEQETLVVEVEEEVLVEVTDTNIVSQELTVTFIEQETQAVIVENEVVVDVTDTNIVNQELTVTFIEQETVTDTNIVDQELTVTFIEQETQVVENEVVVDVEVTDTNIVSQELTVTFIEQETQDVVVENEVVVDVEVTDTDIVSQELTVTFIEQETQNVVVENEIVVDVTDTNLVSEELTVTFIEQETQDVVVENTVQVDVQVTDTDIVSEELTVTFIDQETVIERVSLEEQLVTEVNTLVQTQVGTNVVVATPDARK